MGAIAASTIEMRDRLTHRGPDDEGVFIDSTRRLVIAHRRLSVIDLSEAGAQPILSDDNRYAMVYNGEIYNTKSLRERVSDHQWAGHCDAEVLFHHLIQYGVEDTLNRANGMFAFALIDRQQRSMWLARDRFGKKPLYFAWAGAHAFAFTSELRSLTSLEWFQATIDRTALAEYLLLQYVHAPRTIFENACKLQPGHWMQVEWGEHAIRRAEPKQYAHWDPRDSAIEANPRQNHRDLVHELDGLIDRAVERRMVSDVPLGAMLSSGVDSALVTSSMVRLAGDAPVRSFSLGFTNADESEHVGAAKAATIIGTQHFDQMVAPKITELMPEIAAHLDEPLGDSGCLPMWCLSKMIRSHVKVVLTGDGGDEMFGGYTRYMQTLNEASDIKRRFYHWCRSRGKRWNPADAYCSPRWWMLMPNEIRDVLVDPSNEPTQLISWMRECMNDASIPLVHRMRYLDAHSYMPGAVLAKVDRMTMAHSVEARSPFLDPDIASFAASLHSESCYHLGVLKPLLRDVLHLRFPNETFDQRPKQGFGLPSAGWSNSEMLALADELLLEKDSRLARHLDSNGLQRWVEQQRQPTGFSVFRMWTMLILEMWLRSLDDDAGSGLPDVVVRTDAARAMSAKNIS